MPSRLRRFQSSGSDHFVTFSCYRRRSLLLSDFSRSTFLAELERLRVRHQFLVYGYVLMPEHVHLLVSEPQKSGSKTRLLASTLNVLKCETSKVLKGDRKQFWQTRYHDFNVETHDKLVEKLRYITATPSSVSWWSGPRSTAGAALTIGPRVKEHLWSWSLTGRSRGESEKGDRIRGRCEFPSGVLRLHKRPYPTRDDEAVTDELNASRVGHPP